jgi:hypothetical protein
MFGTNEMSICKQDLILQEELNYETSISVREAASQQSLSGGQGFFKCSCKKTGKVAICIIVCLTDLCTVLCCVVGAIRNSMHVVGIHCVEDLWMMHLVSFLGEGILSPHI